MSANVTGRGATRTGGIGRVAHLPLFVLLFLIAGPVFVHASEHAKTSIAFPDDPFAVPSATAQWVVNELLSYGTVRRRQLGIVATGAQIPHRLMRELDLLGDQAVEVAGLAPDGPAANAGILPGDWIVGLQGRIVSTVDDIHRLLTELPSDEPLTLTVVRGARQQEVEIHPS